jgi:hypothetical protein
MPINNRQKSAIWRFVAKSARTILEGPEIEVALQDSNLPGKGVAIEYLRSTVIPYIENRAARLENLEDPEIVTFDADSIRK